MILRVILVLQLALGYQMSRAQIIEEMSVTQFGKHVDSLIKNGRELEAFDQFQTYANFLPTYNQRMRYKEELLEIQKRITDATNYLNGVSKEKLFEYNKQRILSAIEVGNYQKAIQLTQLFKDEVEAASILFKDIEKLLPIDTIEVYWTAFPHQLFSVPQVNNFYKINNFYNPSSIFDNTLFYLKKDSSLFSGVIISRDNDPQSMETEIAGLNYDRFENGKRVERRYEGYVLTYSSSKSFHKNQLFFGYDSSHYQLYNSVIFDTSDTIRTSFYAYNEELSKEQVFVNGYNKLIKEVEYNLDGTIKKWKELAPVSEKNSQYSYYSCWVNQFGDTISEEFSLLKGELEIIQERTLNESGDTINLSRTVNSFLDGLQVENRRSNDELNFELRYVFDNGKLIDVLSDSVLYFNEDCKIISEEEYIHLMNQDNDYSYFYSGIFKEYFPDVEFKTHPYFLSVSDVVTMNYKKFKKEVRKYFKVKI